MAELHAGWRRIRLRPPPNYPMTGYIARHGFSKGELGPLYLRALVLKQNRTSVVIVVLDLLLISAQEATRLRRLIARSIHIAADRVIIAATHTHSGPLVDSSPFQLSDSRPDRRTSRFMSTVEQKCLRAVADAYRQLKPVRVSRMHFGVRDLASDRTRRSRDTVQSFDLIRFDAHGASALLGVLPCHPTILGAGNRLYSGDLHGEIARQCEEQFEVALIANGAAANISTRFTRSSQTYAQVRRSAASVLKQVSGRQFRSCSGELSSVSELVHLLVRDLRNPVLKLPRQTGRIATVAREGMIVAQQLSQAKEFRRSTVTAPVTVVRLGDISLAALPVELYAETGRFLWKQAQTIALCYANGYWGYVYPPSAGRLDYEALSSPFTEKADAALRRIIIDLRNQL